MLLCKQSNVSSSANQIVARVVNYARMRSSARARRVARAAILRGSVEVESPNLEQCGPDTVRRQTDPSLGHRIRRKSEDYL